MNCISIGVLTHHNDCVPPHRRTDRQPMWPLRAPCPPTCTSNRSPWSEARTASSILRVCTISWGAAWRVVGPGALYEWCLASTCFAWGCRHLSKIVSLKWAILCVPIHWEGHLWCWPIAIAQLLIICQLHLDLIQGILSLNSTTYSLNY